jgi:hypothetical protein
MRIEFWTKLRFSILAVGLIALVAVIWRHRSDEWVQYFLHPTEATRGNFPFDSGSQRAPQTGTAPEKSSDGTGAQGVANSPGTLKKCLQGNKVLYTDPACLAGTKVAAVNGAKVNVLPSAEPKADIQKTRQQGSNALRDALDLSGNDSIKEKMMESVINK